jgi:hypothetical protein
MRKHLSFLLLFCFCHSLVYCQVITGTVFQKNTNNPIQDALVYFNGTSVGTSTNQKGFFKLDISKNELMPLTISALGYYSVTLTGFPTDSTLLIYLTLKVFELKEVTISAKADKSIRKENLQRFKEVFLGITDNASNCEIVNESDIVVYHENDTLKAYSLKPILINNKALGYKISYYLDKFKYDEGSLTYLFTGNIIFNEDPTISKRRKKVIDIRRSNAFLGSRMHFFRALWENDLKAEGFSVVTETDLNANYKDIVIRKYNPVIKDTLKYLKLQEQFGISFFRQFPTSFIRFKADSVYFDRNGYFDGLRITWEGEMEGQRIADMLPYDYLFTEIIDPL